jgi:hypothetical protein
LREYLLAQAPDDPPELGEHESLTLHLKLSA